MNSLEPAALEARLHHHKVPGLGVALIEDFRIAWARGYGRHTWDGVPVTPDSLFQAASMSKPVAAATALTLVERGVLDLDRPVNEKLRQWRLPDSDIAAASEVTLRHLLSHSAGLSVHGFAGYEAGSPVPGVAQILDGLPPANSAPVRIALKPGSQFCYSGGGSTIAQLLVEDAGGQAFARIAQETVLEPVAMTSSYFEQPLPQALIVRAAVGHDTGGQPIAGLRNTYPELAAAGLWTTPTDLAHFLIATMKPGALSPEVARHLVSAQPGLTAFKGGVGLGFFVDGEGRQRRFHHRGGNIGFRGFMTAFPETGQGAVVMSNGDGGIDLAMEIIRGIAVSCDWPNVSSPFE